uniref:Uncharacterized protein n=1 Tax=Zea mays TaxID=4577 RepID=A0A804QM20_MAIZE
MGARRWMGEEYGAWPDEAVRSKGALVAWNREWWCLGGCELGSGTPAGEEHSAPGAEVWGALAGGQQGLIHQVVSGGIHYMNIHVYIHFLYTMCFLSGEVVKLEF